MKTILVVYANKNLTIDEINSNKLRKYVFRTDSDINKGDILKSPIYSSNMIVTDVINHDFKYFNAKSGELSNDITSTMCYPIKTLKLGEENTVIAQKVF